ncbi:hypothetical protein KCU87_g5168, partial [Aureobasidium melanogenum]
MARVVTGKDTGIKVLVGANGNDRTIDIVAIHGIGAHPDDTWCKLREADLDKTRPENYVNWLDDPDMLPSIAPNARIMRYGYESAWCEPEVAGRQPSRIAPEVIKQKTTQVAKRFLLALRQARKGCQNRPLIIIAHCFGGLVTLKAILDARHDSDEWPGMFQSVTGLIFFGTPFRGAEGISQSEILQAALSKYQDQIQTEVLQILDPEDEERVINGVKALVNATMDPPKEQSEMLAKSIQRSMSEVIQLAFRRAEITEHITGTVGRGPQVSRHHEKGDIERITAMIKINTSVQVNERTQHRIATRSLGPLITETYKDSTSMAYGMFEMKTIKRKIANGKHVSLESVITFTASRTQYKEFLLSMHLLQLYGNQSATVMPATIIMHGKISYNHPIFQAIIQGNYDTFTRLIDDRSARIWDRDPEGRSLLIYAITFSQVDVVRYLVQHGINVNDRGKRVASEIVPRTLNSDINRIPSDAVKIAASIDMYLIVDAAQEEAEEVAYQNSYECRPLHDLFAIQRLLLEAGFDPQQEVMQDCYRTSDNYCPLDRVIIDGTHAILKCILDQSQYTIYLSEEHFTQCARRSTIDTWEKLRLLWSRGAMREFKGNIRSHIFRCMPEQLDKTMITLDTHHTLDKLLEHKVKDSKMHHEQIDLDGQVRPSTTDCHDVGHDLDDQVQLSATDDIHDDLCRLLRSLTEYSDDTMQQDSIYCAVRRALLRNDWYRNWMRQHPQKPSVYSISYTPFHHLSWLRSKSSVPRTRTACPLKSDEINPQDRDNTDWCKYFSMDEWPDMSPQEKSIIAHGALVNRWRYGSGRIETLAWSPEGEIHIRWSSDPFDEQSSDWCSDVSVQPSDTADSNSNKVGALPDNWLWQKVPEQSDCVQQKDIYVEHCHEQGFGMGSSHNDQYLPPSTHPDVLQEDLATALLRS